MFIILTFAFHCVVTCFVTCYTAKIHRKSVYARKNEQKICVIFYFFCVWLKIRQLKTGYLST